jgi:hypothetical protein
VVDPGHHPHQEECYTGDDLGQGEHAPDLCPVAIEVEKNDRDRQEHDRCQEHHIQDDEEAAGALQIGDEIKEDIWENILLEEALELRLA